jgi:hypothetical protein
VHYLSSAARAVTFLLLLVLTQTAVVAQGARPGDYPTQPSANPLGLTEVPDSEEQRQFVRRHSFDNPEFRPQQGDVTGVLAAPAQGSKQVRVIYLVPADKTFRADYQSAIANAIGSLQRFYRDQLGNSNAFSLHAPTVEFYQTPHAAAFYSTGANARAGGFYETVLADGFALTGGGFNDPNNRWIFYIDADQICGQYIGGTSGIALLAANDLRGLTGQRNVPVCANEQPDPFGVNRWIGGLGHELGHSFNLPHPPGCDNGSCTGGSFASNSLMWFGYASYPNTYLLDDNKTQLLATGFFNPLSLDPSAQYAISGRVADAGNTALAGATLTINETHASVTSDAAGNFSFTGLPAGGSYTVTVTKLGYRFTPAAVLFNNLDHNQAANFTGTPTSSTVQLSAASYQAGEGGGRVTLTVTRNGDATAPVAVDYRTVDTDTFTVGCADTTNNHGGAYGRCDFATAVGTLTLAAGETSKQFAVPVIDDAHAEGPETFQVVLSNAAGTTLVTPATATVTILDNDAAGAPNPIFTTPFFVRQHYLDFLSREPEQGEPWSNVLNNCSDVNNNPACDRLTVSAAFFGSPEFQLKGAYVFRFYKLAFNRLPEYGEIVADMSFVAGATAEEVYARKVQLATNFTQRSEFQTAYGGLSNSAYVTALLARYQLGSITTPDPAQPDGATKVTLTSTDLVTRLNAGTLTRAQVFRAVADSDQAGAAEFRNAFVGMQYYGYLRRKPDAGGYQNWLDYLATHPDDSRTMVNGFVNSPEYRLRFGPAQ